MHARSFRICLLGLLSLAFGSAPPARADELITLTSDFSTGSMSSAELAPPWNTDLDVSSVCPDAVVRSQGGLLYVVNRLGCDNIQVIDPSQNYATIREFSVGPGSNPQDIALASSSRAFVSRYDSVWLLEVNPSTGSVVDSLSLAAFADADGLPEMHRIFLRGKYLYVQIQRLDRNNGYEPVAPSLLAVIDIDTWSLVDTDPNSPGLNPIELVSTNPSGPMELDITTGDLLVPLSGSFFDLTDGGIERIDLFPWQSRGLVISEAELGGNLLHFTQWRGDRAYAIISDASFVTCLVAFHPVTGTLLGTVYCSDGFELSDCETSAEGWLYLADRDFIDPGLRVFDAASGAPQGGIIPTGLPPFELLVHRNASSEGPGGGAWAAGLPAPNPARDRVTWGVVGGQVAPLRVFDAAGRLVRAIDPSAQGLLEWDLRDERGRPVSSGVYWSRPGSGAGKAQTIVVTR